MASDLKYTERDVKALHDIAKTLDGGVPVVTGGNIHPDIPTIDEVGPGRRINTVGRVEHVWMGFMRAKMGPGQEPITFDAGGAMNHADSFGWSCLGGPYEAVGYNLAKAKAAVAELLAKAPK